MCQLPLVLHHMSDPSRPVQAPVSVLGYTSLSQGPCLLLLFLRALVEQMVRRYLMNVSC